MSVWLQSDCNRYAKVRGGGRSSSAPLHKAAHKTSQGKSESEEYDTLGSDSDTEVGTSSRTESSNHLVDSHHSASAADARVHSTQFTLFYFLSLSTLYSLSLFSSLCSLSLISHLPFASHAIVLLDFTHHIYNDASICLISYLSAPSQRARAHDRSSERLSVSLSLSTSLPPPALSHCSRLESISDVYNSQCAKLKFNWPAGARSSDKLSGVFQKPTRLDDTVFVSTH